MPIKTGETRLKENMSLVYPNGDVILIIQNNLGVQYCAKQKGGVMLKCCKLVEKANPATTEIPISGYFQIT